MLVKPKQKLGNAELMIDANLSRTCTRPYFAATSPKGNVAFSLLKIQRLEATSGKGLDIAANEVLFNSAFISYPLAKTKA